MAVVRAYACWTGLLLLSGAMQTGCEPGSGAEASSTGDEGAGSSSTGTTGAAGAGHTGIAEGPGVGEVAGFDDDVAIEHEPWTGVGVPECDALIAEHPWPEGLGAAPATGRWLIEYDEDFSYFLDLYNDGRMRMSEYGSDGELLWTDPTFSDEVRWWVGAGCFSYSRAQGYVGRIYKRFATSAIVNSVFYNEQCGAETWMRVGGEGTGIDGQWLRIVGEQTRVATEHGYVLTWGKVRRELMTISGLSIEVQQESCRGRFEPSVGGPVTTARTSTVGTGTLVAIDDGFRIVADPWSEFEDYLYYRGLRLISPTTLVFAEPGFGAGCALQP